MRTVCVGWLYSQSTVDTGGCRLHATPECSTAQRCQYGVIGVGAPAFRLEVDAPFGAVDMALGPALGQVQQVGCLLELLVELIAVSVG